MLREKGPRATNQTKNILTNLPGRGPQPYITWKYKPESGIMRERFNESYQPTNNKTYNLGVASNSFYNINDINNNYTNSGYAVSRHPSANRIQCPGEKNDYRNGSFIKFKPNPIKHWRKQLMPNKNINSRSVSVRQAIDVPGGTTRLNVNTTLDCNVNRIPNYVKNNAMNIDKAQKSDEGCILYNPQRIQRSASTIVKKNYYQTNAAYLKSRVKLYSQNQTISERPTNDYLSAELKVLPPSDSKTSGSQLFNSTSSIDYSYNQSCISGCNYPNVIYKPNNINFSKQGAVTSDLRTFNLQRLAINKNANSLKESFGTAVVNNSQYRGVGEAPITTKTFNQKLPGDNISCKNIQIRNTQNSGQQLSGGTGRRIVCNYNEPGFHNGDIVPSLNGNIIIKNRGRVNFNNWAKGPLFPQKFSCQTIRQSLGTTRQLQNNNLKFFGQGCNANPYNPPKSNVGTNGTPLSVAHR